VAWCTAAGFHHYQILGGAVSTHRHNNQHANQQPFKSHPHQQQAFVLTFITYVLFHATRKPPSIVKRCADGGGQACGTTTRNPAAVQRITLSATSAHGNILMQPPSKQSVLRGGTHSASSKSSDPDPNALPETAAAAAAAGWAPFNGPRGSVLLGQMDLAFLLAYSVGLFAAGHVADRVDVRMFLAWGMVVGGLMTTLAGLAFFWELHSFAYFVVVMVSHCLLDSAFYWSRHSGWLTCFGLSANLMPQPYQPINPINPINRSNTLTIHPSPLNKGRRRSRPIRRLALRRDSHGPLVR